MTNTYYSHQKEYLKKLHKNCPPVINIINFVAHKIA